MQLTATQSGTILKQGTVPWPAASTGPVEVGLGLPSDTTGSVDVTGIAFLNNTIVGQGTATQDTIVKGQNNGPVSLVLQPPPATGDDGGVGDSATGGTDGAPSADAAPDVQPADGAPDAASADAPADAPPDRPLDGSAGDRPVADVPPDVTTGSDSAGPQWSTPLSVQNIPSSVYPTPSVAVSPVTGDAVVVWYHSINGLQAIHYAAASDAWDTSPATLESRGTPLSWQVGVDGNGHYVVVWAQDDPTLSPSLFGIWASYSSNGVTWSNAPVLIAAGPSNASYGDVRLAVNRVGQAWVVWDQTISSTMSSSDPEWVYALFLSGTTAKTPVIVKAGTTNGEARYRQPRVAIDSNGNGLVVWTELDNNPAVGKDSTWAAALADGTTPSPQLIESYDTDLTFGGDVAMNADGQGVAIWAEQRQSGGSTVADIFARRYSVTAGWDPEPPRLYAANYSGNLALDEDRYGTVDIGWSQPTASGNYQAMFSTQAVGGAWSSLNLETDDLARGYTTTDIEPQVRTALTSGDVLMAWRKRVDGSTFAPHFRWRSNGTWGVESEVGKIANLYASGIHLGVADDGRAVAAWTYSHCYYDSGHPDKCTDVPLSSLPADAQAAIANLFVAVCK